MFENLKGSPLDRRSFLRGSAMFAAAIGVSVLPAFAQQQPQQPPKPEEEKEKEKNKDKQPKDPFADGENGSKKDEKEKEKLIDAEGREYRVCPQCGNNMYKQGKMWVCENCGYSYVE